MIGVRLLIGTVTIKEGDKTNIMKDQSKDLGTEKESKNIDMIGMIAMTTKATTEGRETITTGTEIVEDMTKETEETKEEVAVTKKEIEIEIDTDMKNQKKIHIFKRENKLKESDKEMYKKLKRCKRNFKRKLSWIKNKGNMNR